jgi:hypothetical protein
MCQPHGLLTVGRSKVLLRSRPGQSGELLRITSEQSELGSFGFTYGQVMRWSGA